MVMKITESLSFKCYKNGITVEYRKFEVFRTRFLFRIISSSNYRQVDTCIKMNNLKNYYYQLLSIKHRFWARSETFLLRT